MDEARLIAEIHQRPALWDMLHQDFKTREITQKLWKDVADSLNVDDGE